MGTHMLYGITQCYLPSGDIPAFTLAKPVLNIVTPKGCKVELIWLSAYILRWYTCVQRWSPIPILTLKDATAMPRRQLMQSLHQIMYRTLFINKYNKMKIIQCCTEVSVSSSPLASASRTSISTSPRRFLPCHKWRRLARGSSAAKPMPHFASYGLASASTLPAVLSRMFLRKRFCENYTEHKTSLLITNYKLQYYTLCYK